MWCLLCKVRSLDRPIDFSNKLKTIFIFDSDSRNQTPWKRTNWSIVWARSPCFNANYAQQHVAAKQIYAFTYKSYTQLMSQSNVNVVATNFQIVTRIKCTQRHMKVKNVTSVMCVLMHQFHSVIWSHICWSTLTKNHLFVDNVSLHSGKSSYWSDMKMYIIIQIMCHQSLKRNIIVARLAWKGSGIKGWVKELF